MKYGVILGIVVFVSGTFGCQSRHLMKNSHENGTPANSIDGYAKEHGISRAEAVKRMRAELVPPSDSDANKTLPETTAATFKNTNK